MTGRPARLDGGIRAGRLTDGVAANPAASQLIVGWSTSTSHT